MSVAKHCDTHGTPLAPGTLVQWHNADGQRKHGPVVALLETCITVHTPFAYYVKGKRVAGEGDFPLVPRDCEVIGG